ncbi:MAG: glyoxalase, partial [Clostridia bacterium]|nr:glyoxalase [Clostridia bacterium]
PPGCTGLYHVALRLPHRTALGRVLVRLVDIGYPLEGGADHLVSEAVYLRDPEGNGLELYVDRPRETWTWDGRSVRMGTEPLDWRSLLAEGRAAGPAGLPDEVVVGHVHLTVSRLDRAERFYHGILGLDVTLRYGPSALFLSYGGYHHHVGCNTWAGVGAPPPPPGCTGLVRFSLRLDAATLADVRVRAEKAGFDVTDGADGWQLSDPDGGGVELLPLA